MVTELGDSNRADDQGGLVSSGFGNRPVGPQLAIPVTHKHSGAATKSGGAYRKRDTRKRQKGPRKRLGEGRRGGGGMSGVGSFSISAGNRAGNSERALLLGEQNNEDSTAKSKCTAPEDLKPFPKLENIFAKVAPRKEDKPLFIKRDKPTWHWGPFCRGKCSAKIPTQGECGCYDGKMMSSITDHQATVARSFAAFFSGVLANGSLITPYLCGCACKMDKHTHWLKKRCKNKKTSSKTCANEERALGDSWGRRRKRSFSVLRRRRRKRSWMRKIGKKAMPKGMKKGFKAAGKIGKSGMKFVKKTAQQGMKFVKGGLSRAIKNMLKVLKKGLKKAGFTPFQFMVKSFICMLKKKIGRRSARDICKALQPLTCRNRKFEFPPFGKKTGELFSTEWPASYKTWPGGALSATMHDRDLSKEKCKVVYNKTTNEPILYTGGKFDNGIERTGFVQYEGEGCNKCSPHGGKNRVVFLSQVFARTGANGEGPREQVCTLEWSWHLELCSTCCCKKGLISVNMHSAVHEHDKERDLTFCSIPNREPLRILIKKSSLANKKERLCQANYLAADAIVKLATSFIQIEEFSKVHGSILDRSPNCYALLGAAATKQVQDASLGEAILEGRRGGGGMTASGSFALASSNRAGNSERQSATLLDERLGQTGTTGKALSPKQRSPKQRSGLFSIGYAAGVKAAEADITKLKVANQKARKAVLAKKKVEASRKANKGGKVRSQKPKHTKVAAGKPPGAAKAKSSAATTTPKSGADQKKDVDKTNGGKNIETKKGDQEKDKKNGGKKSDTGRNQDVYSPGSIILFRLLLTFIQGLLNNFGSLFLTAMCKSALPKNDPFQRSAASRPDQMGYWLGKLVGSSIKVRTKMGGAQGKKIAEDMVMLCNGFVKALTNSNYRSTRVQEDKFFTSRPFGGLSMPPWINESMHFKVAFPSEAGAKEKYGYDSTFAATSNYVFVRSVADPPIKTPRLSGFKFLKAAKKSFSKLLRQLTNPSGIKPALPGIKRNYKAECAFVMRVTHLECKGCGCSEGLVKSAITTRMVMPGEVIWLNNYKYVVWNNKTKNGTATEKEQAQQMQNKAEDCLTIPTARGSINKPLCKVGLNVNGHGQEAGKKTYNQEKMLECTDYMSKLDGLFRPLFAIHRSLTTITDKGKECLDRP